MPEVPEAPEAPEPPEATLPQAAPVVRTDGGSIKHVARDYSYVIFDLRRLAVVMAFIIVGLFIAAAGLRWV